MKKIKKLWVENRVLFVLFLIVIICLFVIAGVAFKYFFGATKSSYGDRLNSIQDIPITDEIKNSVLSKLSEDETILDSKIDVKGKVVYLTINFKEGVSLEDAKNKALASLDYFEETYRTNYDFNYTIKEETTEANVGFLLMGAKNMHGSGLVWNNNTKVETNEE